MEASALRQPLVGVPPSLEHVSRNLLKQSLAGRVIDRPEDDLLVAQGGLQGVPDARAQRLQDRGGKDDRGRVPMRDDGQSWHGYLLTAILPGRQPEANVAVVFF